MTDLRFPAAVVPGFLVLLLSLSATAQVERFEDVVDHRIGERITRNHQVNDYLEHLARTSNRVTAFEIGTTYNRKRQMGAILTAPENHARLEQIRRNAQQLDDPRGLSPAETEAIIAEQPAILYIGGSIHGFELSGTEGILRLLEHYTRRHDAETLEHLRNTVMIIDPTINADGRDAFAEYNHQKLGRTVITDNDDWSNDFNAWQAREFRTSHYFFDLNRDWFAHTHNETRNRAELLRHWRPQAAVDAHEMGPNTEFYVDPPAEPVSPLFPSFSSSWMERYGRAHAEMFDRHHVEYTSGELFNFFYPAYFTSYLTHQGAVGMLYEQGSSRGLGLERQDGTVRTLADASLQQFLAMRAMIGLSSAERESLLRDYHRANVAAIEAGRSGTRRYLLTEGGDPALLAEAVNLLMRSGVEVQRLDSEVTLNDVRDREGNTLGSQRFGAGSYVIEAAQPRSSFLRNLLEPEVPVPEHFLEQARQRLDRGENPRFYDITAWSLPLLYNLQGFSSRDAREVPASAVDAPVSAGSDADVPRAQYAYLMDGTQARALATIPYLRQQDIRVSVLYQPTQIDQRPYAAGTVIVRTDGEIDRVHAAVSELAQRFSVQVDAVDSGRVDPGFPMLGSVEGTRISEPKVALVAGHPVDAYSFGWAWHTLDRSYEVPHIVIRNRSLGSTPLERFNVIVLPEVSDAQALSEGLGEDGRARLQRWVRDGGTLVTLGSATDFVREQLELTGLRSWYDRDDEDNSEPVQQQITVPGAFFRTELDRENWLTSGYPQDLPMLINSSRLLKAPEGPPSPRRNAAVQVAEDPGAPIAGHAWEENLERLPGRVLVYEEREGAGRVIAFAEDPNFRGYWRGADRLFLNAIILGPSAP